MRMNLVMALAGVLLVRSLCAVQFDVAEPIWTMADREEINSSVVFTTFFKWDGKSPIELRLAGCSIFKVFVNGEFVAYGPARGPHGWFRMDEWDLSRVARKGNNRLNIVGVAYNTTTYYIVEHEPFLQAEVLVGDKVVRATGDGEWDANFTQRVRKTRRYSLQRAQSEVYEVARCIYWEWWKSDGFLSESLIITNAPSVKLLERGAPYPKFEVDGSYRPTNVLSVRLRTGELGEAPSLWGEKSSFLGRTYPDDELQYDPAVDWWRRTIEATAKIEGEAAKVDATRGVRYEGAVNNTGFLRLKAKVTKPGRLLVGFDEILVDGRLDFLNRFKCNNIVMWDVKEPGDYDFESFEPYTFKFAEVIMLEGAATIERLEMRAYKNPNATRACTLEDPADRKIFEAARETFAQNAVDVLTDCPSRERAGWLCDSYFTGKAEHFFTGKNEIERTFLRNFALAEKFPHLPEGMVPMCYPGDHINKNFIPNWSMWFILELANYFERTGDRETVDLLKPRVEGLLKFYAQYLNADGALENLPAWVFVEWSHANDPKLVKDGVNWPSNMTYSEALAKAARLYGRPELAEQSERLKAHIRKRSYDGVWFRDNAKHPDVTETCQYYAFFHGIATPKTHPGLWKRLTDEFGPERTSRGLYREVWPSNAFVGNLLRLIVLKREGRDAQVAREIRGYYFKMAEATGTLWENDRPKASCNHGFASYLAILLDGCNQALTRAEIVAKPRPKTTKTPVPADTGIYIGSGVYANKGRMKHSGFCFTYWEPEKLNYDEVIDLCVKEGVGNTLQFWQDNESLLDLARKAKSRGLYSTCIYSVATNGIARRLTSDLGGSWLGYDFGERFTFSLNTDWAGRVATLGAIADEYMNRVHKHVGELHAAGWGSVMATSANFSLDYEVAAGVEMPCTEDFPFGDLTLASALSRGLYRQYDLPMWGSHLAHEWYSWIPHKNPYKMKTLETAFRLKYMTGAKIVINESGNWQLQSNLCEDSPMSLMPKPIRRLNVDLAAPENAAAVKSAYPEAKKKFPYIDYRSPVSRKYRRAISDFTAFCREHPAPKGQPEATWAIAKGNLDLGGAGYIPGNAICGAFDLAKTNPNWMCGVPEMSWDVVRRAVMPMPPMLAPNKNIHFSASPYGLCDIVSFACDNVTAEHLLRNYKVLMFAGWNTCSPRQYRILCDYVKGGGKLVIGLAHLSTDDKREYTNLSVGKLVNGGDFTELCGFKVVGETSRKYWATGPSAEKNCLGFAARRRFGYMCLPLGKLEFTAPVENFEELAVDDEDAEPFIIRCKSGKGEVFFMNWWAYPAAANMDVGCGAELKDVGMVGYLYQYCAKLGRGNVYITGPDFEDPDEDCGWILYSYFPDEGKVYLLNLDYEHERRCVLQQFGDKEFITMKPAEFRIVESVKLDADEKLNAE